MSSVQITGSKSYLPIMIKNGEKLARVEPRAVGAMYEKYDFVKEAKVSRNWMTGKVTIDITPRTPIAIFNNKAIDASGRVFNLSGNSPEALPRIEAINSQTALAGAIFLASLPEEIKSDLVVLKVRSTGVYDLELQVAARTIELRWGFPTENALKAQVYKALMARPENDQVKRIDLSAPHAPVVK